MNSFRKPPESLEEIVFSTRNKAYGAYELRKKYQKYTLISLIIALFIIGGAVTYPVVASYLNRYIAHGGENTVTGDFLPRPPDDKPIDIPPPEPPVDAVTRARFIAPEVSTEDSIESSLAVVDDINAKPVSPDVPTDEPLTVAPEQPEKTIETQALPAPFLVVEEMPSFPGGEEARIRFLLENIKYPDEARDLGVQGRVYLTFIVETDGSITDIKLMRGIGAGCDEEAVRVAKIMPKWVPGKQRGIPVRVQFNMPVKFTLAG